MKKRKIKKKIRNTAEFLFNFCADHSSWIMAFQFIIAIGIAILGYLSNDTSLYGFSVVIGFPALLMLLSVVNNKTGYDVDCGDNQHEGMTQAIGLLFMMFLEAISLIAFLICVIYILLF